MGPYLSIAPLEREFESEKVLFLVEGPAKEARRATGQAYWELSEVVQRSGTIERFLKKEAVQAIIAGTSDGLPEGNIEEQAAVAAREKGIPLFVIEDFPGNYRHRPSARLDGLFVEDETQREWHVSYGVPRDRIHCISNPRYDSLRGVDRDTLRDKTRASLQVVKRRVVLWAGQPDEARSYEALERLLPVLTRQEMALLFKAHPRDRLYREGAYESLLSGLALCRDVTSEPEMISLCCAADLVVTEFSSVGVEAGYLDTPALYVLFDDLGKAYLRRHKGYDIVPWVKRGCAFVMDSKSEMDDVIATALFNDEARARVRKNFSRWYGTRPLGAQAVRTIIHRALNGRA